MVRRSIEAEVSSFDYEGLMKESATAPPSDQAENPYLGLMQNYRAATDMAARGTSIVNAGANSDTASRAQELAPKLGIPSVVIEGDLPTYEARAKAIHDNAVVSSNPILSNWVANNREAARTAQDDFDKLGFVEKSLTALKSGAESALQSNQLGRLYNTKQAADTFGIKTPETDKQISDLETSMGKAPELPGGYGLTQKATGFAASIVDNLISGLPEAAGGAALGAASTAYGGGVGAIPGAIAGEGVGFKLDMSRISAGLNYRATQYIKDSEGQPLTQSARNVGALLTGALTYGLASVGTKATGEISSDALSHLTSDAVTEALQRHTVKTALANLSKNVLKGAATGAVINGGMEFSTILGEEVAKQISGGNFSTVFNDPEVRAMAVTRLADAAESGAIMFGVMHGVAGSIGLGGDLVRARQAHIDIQTLTDLQKGASDSKLRERNPSAFSDFISKQTDGTPIENLYLPVDKVLKLYQEANIDYAAPRAEDPIFGFVKDMPEQIQQAGQHRGDIVIPTADYITYLAGSDIGRKLLDDVRVRPDAMSLNEAKTHDAAAEDTIKQMVTHSQELFPEDRIYQDVLGQTREAGFKGNEAKHYAALYAARYGTRGERLGVDPWQAYQESGITIQHADVARGTPATDKTLFQSNLNKPMFYSQLSSILEKKLPNSGPASQMKNIIANLQNNGEFKQEEYHWSGIDQWLSQQTGKVTKEQILDYVKSNQINVTEKMLSGESSKSGPQIRMEAENLAAMDGKTWDSLTSIERDHYVNMTAGSDTTFGEYQLSGGKNYKELLLTLPNKDTRIQRMDELKNLPQTTENLAEYNRLSEETKGRSSAQFNSPHFEEPNILAHVRFNERTDAEGKRVLFMEELQSDWAQKGKRSGFRVPPEREAQLRAKIEEIEKIGKDATPEQKKQWVDAMNELQPETNGSKPPSAPFVTKTDSWVSLALKRMIRYAAENGFDKVAWTTGEQQVSRYDLSKKVDKIDYNKDSDGKYHVAIYPIEEYGAKTTNKVLTEKELPDVVGKEVAKKMINSEGNPEVEGRDRIPTGIYTLRGLDLKVGGEGMKVFYDKIVPSIVDKYVKKWGAKVGESELDSHPIHSLDITPAMKESVMQGQTLFQEGKRGSITFGQGKAIIDLFKDRDLSTVLHESSHLWLEELKSDAARPDAPEQLKNDFATVLKELGVTNPEDILTEHHEKFARAFETYFMEGKAPSPELAPIFQRFKTWLTNIYRSLVNLGSPVSPELRGVFDRLLASDEQIGHAQQSIGVFRDRATQQFRDKLSGLMTKAEFNAYTKAIDNANAQAHEALLAKMMEKIKKERTSEWKSERSKMTEAVIPEVDAKPEIKALGGPKLDKATVEKMYTGNEGMAYFLPKQMLAKEGGVHPDSAAELSGFPSGDALLQSLIKAEQEKRRLDVETGKTKSIRQHMIDQEVDRRMIDKYGDFLNTGDIEKEALAAVHNKSQEEALATELRVMGREQGHANIPLDQAREWAKNTIADRPVGEVSSPLRYARAENKAARSAEAALLSGKPAEAYQFKRQQILNHLLFRAAEDANKEIGRGQKLMERLAGEKSFKGIDQEYTDRIHDLLARFGFRIPREQEEITRGLKGETLEGFVSRKFTEGYELAVDPRFYDPSLKGDIEKLTVEQFTTLTDAVRSLQAIGRDENTIIVGGEKVDRETAISQMVDHLRVLPQKKPSDYYRPEDAGTLRKIKDRALAYLRSADASALKEEQLLDWMDGNDPNGPFNKYVFRPLKEAQLRADDMRRSVAKQVQGIVEGMPKEWNKNLNEEVANTALTNLKTGQPFKFNRKRMLSIALNMGNDDNATKLANGYGWSDSSIRQFLDDNMTAHDWQFVQKMWDTVGQFRTQIDELQRRITGVGIDFVKETPYLTKFGTVSGGYFPIVYDPFRSPEAERHMAKSAATMFENQYYRATTAKGHTIERVQGVKRPIALDLDIIPWKIGQVIHDLSFREAVMDAGKLLSDERVRAGIDDSFGHEYTKTLRPWLQSIANSRNINDLAVDWIDKTLRWARTNATMVGIGFRVSTMYKHGTTALSNSFGELGGKWMMQGVKEYFGTPQKMGQVSNFVMEKSGEMRNRLDHYDRDLRENLKTLLNENGFKAEAQRYATYGVGYMDLASAIPTWLGGYRKALSEGMSDADAVYFADKTVRKAHGSQGLVDLAALQRGPEFQKLLTMFYGFFNHIYNRQRDTIRQAGAGIEKVKVGDFAGAKRDFAAVLARTITYLIIPAIVEQLYTHGGPNEDKEESWGGWAGKAILAEVPAGIPIVRDIAKAAIEGRDYEFSPIVRAVSTVLGTGRDINKFLTISDGEPSKKWLRHAIETTGYLTGWPSGQLGVSSQFLWDTVDGEQQPQSLYDWYQGITSGKVEGK